MYEWTDDIYALTYELKNLSNRNLAPNLRRPRPIWRGSEAKKFLRIHL